jgi:hypothetical protein
MTRCRSHRPHKEIRMEPHDNMQLALQKAISSHEQAAAGLNDLITELSEDLFEKMLGRIEQNIAELREAMTKSRPGDHV